MLTILLKSDFSDKIHQEFFKVVALSVRPFSNPTWTFTKKLEKNFAEIRKDTLSRFEKKKLEAAPNKTAAVRLLTTHLPSRSV